MQRRLLISTVAVAVAAVLLLGVPLAFALIRLQSDDARQQFDHDAGTLARDLSQRSQVGLTIEPQQVARALPGRYVIISGNFKTVRVGPKPPLHDTLKGHASSGGVSVTVEADDSVVNGGIRGGLVLITSLAGLAVGVAVVLALLLARRLARPLTDLAEAADRLGSGDARPLGRRYGLQELDRVAEGLDGSAQRINDLLAAEREFAVDASHQLRTPLTALSMRLEEMIGAAEFPDVVREEGAAALAQTERLTDVVSQLLGRHRSAAAGKPELVSVDDLIAQQVVEWDPAYRRAGRKLELAGEKDLHAFVTAGGVAQVVATLLDNALTHGAGTVTIRTSQTPKSVVIEVRDEGRGVPAELVPRIFERSVSGRPGGTGLGLSLARTLAAASGGQVVLVRPRPAAFAAFFPRAAPEARPQRAVTGPA